jgi:hypothetical protein
MSRSRIVVFSIAMLLAGTVSAAVGKLVRQFVGATPGGEAELVCVYSAGGPEFELRFPVGNACPAYAESGTP